MAGSVNKVIIIGRLGADPEVRTFQSGAKVCNLRIATSETWKDRSSGERRERTQWHSVAIFNEALISVAENYLRKGSRCYLEGKLETRKWQDRSGQDLYTTEVTLRQYNGELVLLNGRDERSDDAPLGSQSEFPRDYDARPSQAAGFSEGTYGSAQGAGINDDIPF